MGVDVHEKRRMNGNADPNPSGGTRVSDSGSTSLRKGRFTHDWSYYKAKAQKRNKKREEAQKCLEQ